MLLMVSSSGSTLVYWLTRFVTECGMVAKSILRTVLVLLFSLRPLRALSEAALIRLGRRYTSSILLDRVCSHYASAISKLELGEARRVAALQNGARLVIGLEDYFHR